MNSVFFFVGFTREDTEGASIKDFDFKSFWMSSCTTSDPLAILEPQAKKRRQRKRNNTEEQEIERTAELEVTQYLSEETVPFEQCPLEWWRANSYKYPCLSNVAKKLFSAPPSSVESERLFSIGGNIHTSKRNLLLTVE